MKSPLAIDLRSDTVTKPTPGMLDAMLHAEVGDDVFGDDPTINKLEEKCAKLLGMEAAVYCPSGTMTNQIGINILTQPYDEVICYKGSHIYKYEGGGVAGNSGVNVRLLQGDRGRISVEEIGANINHSEDAHYPRTAVVSLENTVVREAGSYYQLDQIAAIRHPIDDTRSRAGLVDSGEDRKSLPPVSESDAIVRETLSGVSGGSAFERYFYPQGIVRRFVATVDNLPRKSVAPKVTVVKPLPGSFLAAGSEGNLSISGDNAARYTPYVQFARAVDTKALVALYVRFYPWFQQAYQDLGYPSGYFNDRLIDVIDNLLAAPATSTPVALVQPHVLFEFANPDLEALSAGQKIMVRMGGENASQIGIKLRELRRMLTGAISPP